MLIPQRRSLAALALSLVFALSSLAMAASGVAPAPLDFKLRTADGGEITSEMLRGDIVVFAFGAAWLQLPRAQVQGVQELADEFGERNVRVYWVSTDSDSPKSKNYATDVQLRAFASKNGLKVAVLRDPDGALFKQTGVPGNQLPAIVILDRQGNVSGESIGGFDPRRKLVDTLSPRLNRMLNGKEQ
ncbi:MAG: peroxiredoxin family protein [Acidobacteria bacterium]|nr:peroxiredoxin family protein [Acidobacteriota bacterium]